jgi:uncharacterized protein (TIGR02996 family)
VTDERGARLAQLIEENPEDIEAFRAYGDWLEEQGDPRSQLMGMQMTRTRLTDRTKLDHIDRRLEEFFEVHRDHFLGKLAKILPKPTASRQARETAPKIEWRNGFIYKVDVTRSSKITIDKFLDILFAHPSGRFLVELKAAWPESASALAATLVERVPRSLRRLELGARDADVSALWSRIPFLEQLDLWGDAILGTIDLPALRVGRFDVASPLALRDLARAKLPTIEYLRLRIWPEDDISDELIGPIFARGDLPALSWIELGFDTHVAAVLRAIRESPLNETLTDITLRRRDEEIDKALVGINAVIHPDR